LDGEQNFVLGKLNCWKQYLLNVVTTAPPTRDWGLITVVLFVVGSNRDCVWNVELL
jgi:hypothetical protein